MPLNEQDVRALTYLAKRIRTETHGAGQWDEAGTAAKISELKGQGLAQAAERVIRHAADREARTPGAILRPFTPAAQPVSQRNPFDPTTACDICERSADVHRPHDGHDYVSRLDAMRRRSDPDASALEYARQAIGDTKATTGDTQ
jgi:hypothetical protein